MVDTEEYGDEEWIARSRGNDDAAVARRPPVDASGSPKECLRPELDDDVITTSRKVADDAAP
jgi:hypothetical protein